MKDLWEATGKLCLDEPLRRELQRVAILGPDGHPLPESMKAAQALLAAAGVAGLSLYAAAELCRWANVRDANSDGMTRLADLGARVPSPIRSKTFVTTLGLVALDPEVLDPIRSETDDKILERLYKFFGDNRPTTEDAAALGTAVRSPGFQAAADDVIRLLWESGGCNSRLEHYPGYVPVGR